MNKAKKVSRKGLKVIFGDNLTDALKDIENFKEKTDNLEASSTINVKEVRPNPFQPRKIFKKEELNELANSIKEHGLLSPIVVVKDVKGYTLVAGERRLRAHKILDKIKIKAIILKINEKSMEEIALVENLQRENLNAIEEAIALDALVTKHKLTQKELSKRISKSRTYVTNSLRLLKLPKVVQQMVLESKLTSGHAKVLLGLDKKEDIIELAKKAATNKWSVRKIEWVVKNLKKPRIIKVLKFKSKDILYVEQLLREKLSTKVSIKNKSIVIQFTSTSDLNRILEKMDVLEK